MIILAIETSCDETAAAVVHKLPNGNLKILSNIVASSEELHTKTGGIIPENAAREQIKSIIPVIDEALKIAKLEIENLTALAVTVGPGLIGSLLVGVETAKTLSYIWKKPLVPVNHLMGHIFANFLNNSPEFPILALIVSGGHTDLVYMRQHDEIKYIGATRDDAAGEAFDKCARLLGLPYPGGPSIAKAADEFLKRNRDIKLDLFPRPMIDSGNFDFSFSGLKTSVLRMTQSKDFEKYSKEELAAQVQEAIVDCLISKSIKAIEKYKPKSFLLGGGVASNSRLRKKLQTVVNSQPGMMQPSAHHSGYVMRGLIHVPEPSLCTDNAAAVAAAALINYKPVNWKSVSVNPELTIVDQLSS